MSLAWHGWLEEMQCRLLQLGYGIHCRADAMHGSCSLLWCRIRLRISAWMTI